MQQRPVVATSSHQRQHQQQQQQQQQRGARQQRQRCTVVVGSAQPRDFLAGFDRGAGAAAARVIMNASKMYRYNRADSVLR